VADVRTGLLIDWGGVLTTNLFASFADFCAANGLDPQAVATAFRGDPTARALLEDFETGRITAAAFEPRLAEVLGLATHEQLIAGLFAGIGPDEAMVEAVAAAKAAGVRTGLLSNSWGAGSYDRSVFPRLFDVLVISGEEGIRKPEPAIYDLAAQRIGLAPEKLVFIDDLPFNLKPARERGMATVHHTSAAETIPQLEALLGVSLRAAA
jgi:epoxide hydrolase-like predicted phosphatase